MRKYLPDINKNIRYLHIFIVCLFIMIFGAGNSTQTWAASDDDWKTVRFSCDVNNSLYVDENGNPDGYCYEYINALASINHWKLKYVKGDWNASVRNLEEGKVDIIFPTQKTKDREKTMLFSDIQGGYEPIVLYAKEDSKLVFDDFSAYDGSKIVVTKAGSNENALQKFAKEHNFTYTPVYKDTLEEKKAAVENGEADFIAASTLYNLNDYMVVSVLSYEIFYYSLDKDNIELKSELDAGMKQLMLQQPKLAANIYLKFLGGEIKVAKNKEESNWINNNKIIVGVYKDTPPLYHEDADGNTHGIYVDILEQLEENSGADIELYPINRSEYGYDLLDEGIIDVLLGSNDTLLKEQENKRYVYSAPVMEYVTVAVSKGDYVLNEDDAPVFALTSARKYWEPIIKKDYPNSEICYYKTAKDCLIAIQKGNADMTMLNSCEYNFHSRNPRFSNLIEWEGNRINSDVVMVAEADADINMLSILDKAIVMLDDTLINEVTTRNLNKSYDDVTLYDKLYANKKAIIAVIIIIVLTLGALITYLTVKRRYVKKLEYKNKQLEQANDTKRLFMSRMSHELRTPLNAIAGYSHLLEEELDKHDEKLDTEKEQVKSIRMAQEFLLKIIDEILDTQQIETDKFKLNYEVYDAQEYLNSVVEMARIDAKEKKVNFEFKRMTHISRYYRGDGARIGQILLKILNNAIKFTPEGGNVTMTAESVKQEGLKTTLKFVITDTGIGMSQEFVENKLFHIFSQEDGGICSPYDGTGIGLSFAKNLAVKMNGDIICQSEKGKGSKFSVYVVVDAVPEGDVSQKTEPKVSENTKDVDFSGMNILVCEDNEINQLILKELLEKKNCKVSIAGNGKVGLNMFIQSEVNEYQMILMDIRMPVMNGYDAVLAIRKLDRIDAATIPILAVSANAYDEDIRKSLECGMNEHLIKPIDPKKLYDAIERYHNM